MFEYSHIEEIDMSDMDFSKVMDVYAMFRSKYIKKINLSNVKFDAVEDVRYMFENDQNLEEINLTNTNVNRVMNMN
jgi:DNA-binding protein